MSFPRAFTWLNALHAVRHSHIFSDPVLSGFFESHKPPPSGDTRGILSAHRDGHQNGQQSRCALLYRFVDCRPGGRQGDT